MPVYKYRCQKCEEVFEELFLSFNEAKKNEVVCPNCESVEIKRVFDKVSIATPSITNSGDIADDPEEYKEMHYHEKKKDWNKAADAAKGVSDFARKKFLQKAQQEE